MPGEPSEGQVGTELTPIDADEFDSYFDETIDEADAQFEQGVARLGTGDFGQAVEDFRNTAQLLRSLIDEGDAGSAHADEATVAEWAEARPMLDALALLADAYLSFALGQAERIGGRNPGVAIGHFNRAAEKFGHLNEAQRDGRWQVLSSYNRVLSDISSGFEKLLRADPASAAADFQRAKGALEVIVEDTLPDLLTAAPFESEEHEGLVDLEAYLEADLVGVTALLQLARFRDEGAKGNSAAALTAAEELCKLVEQQVEAFPPEAPKWLRRQLEAELHTHKANREVMRGHVLKDEGKWDGALASYAEARAELLLSAESYVKTGLPAAQAAQEACINQASTTIDVFIRQCKTERELRCEVERLREELRDLRTSLLERLRDHGIHITNEASPSVIATIDQTAEIVQHVELKVRNTIGEARDAIAHSGLDPQVKDELQSQANALLASEEKGPGFLDKAKSFSEKVSAIVQNAAEAAGPLVPVAKALALLLL